VIHFDNVTKTYPNQNRPALENVNIDVEKGEFIFLVGPSGSGKSTFLRLVLKEERPTGGRIHVAGKDLARLTNWKVPHLRRRIGCVFQDFRLLPNKNVYQNIAFALEVIGSPGGSSARSCRRSSTWSAWRASATACPTSCPAASSSGSPWPGRSSTAR